MPPSSTGYLESLDVECEPSSVSPVSVFRDATVIGHVSSVQG